MDEIDLLTEAFDRLPDLVSGAVDGLTPEQLRWAPSAGANTIGWLVWHLARIQDDHIAELLGEPQAWMSDSWAARFGLQPGTTETGYGHTAEQVAALRPDGPGTLTAYYTAVAHGTRRLLGRTKPGDLDRVIDDKWDPPVTLGVRLVSVLSDDLQHVGQAAYIRGLLPSD